MVCLHVLGEYKSINQSQVKIHAYVTETNNQLITLSKVPLLLAIPNPRGVDLVLKMSALLNIPSLPIGEGLTHITVWHKYHFLSDILSCMIYKYIVWHTIWHKYHFWVCTPGDVRSTLQVIWL